jgi:fermentation-respiration switch protein FrsA (DUF1100 family)
MRRAIAIPVALLFLLTSCDKRAASSIDLEAKLVAQVKAWVAAGDLVRPDGFTYAVDVGQLLIYAAKAGDRGLYTALRDGPVRGLVMDDPADEFTRGMVQWRVKAGDKPDASGTTEALRIAQGLWEGAAKFDFPADRERAVMIVHAYARHAGTDQGVWLIRNYFNFTTRAFATNTFLVDYDPDFLRTVARGTGDARIVELADKSYAIVRGAVTPCGLIYDLVQPEVLTLMPDLGMTAFSPNDVVQLSNSTTVAERCAIGAPEIGQKILDFGRSREWRMGTYYLGRTGEPIAARDGAGRPRPPVGLGPEGNAGMLRLAAKLGDHAAAAEFLRRLTPQAASFAAHPYEPRLYLAGEILLALHEAEPRHYATHGNRQLNDAAAPSASPHRRHSWPRRIARVVIAIVLGATLVWWLLLYFMQTRMLFPADMAGHPPAAFPPRGGEVWKSDIPGGTVEAWFISAGHADAAHPAPLAVIFHGNAELIDEQQELIGFFRSLGFAVLAPEYRGYGRSAGTPSQAAIRGDAASFLGRAVAHDGVDASRVVFFGRSIGGGVAIDLAGAAASLHLPRPAAIITASTFYSVKRIANHFYAPGLLVKNPYRNDLTLPALGVPTLMFHGTRDDIIPYEDGKALHALIPAAKWVEFDCGHNDFPGPGNEPRFEREIVTFLREAKVIGDR